MDNQLKMMPAYAVYKGKKPGDKVTEELSLPKTLSKRKRKSRLDNDIRKKRKKFAVKKSMSQQLKAAGARRTRPLKKRVEEPNTDTVLSNETDNSSSIPSVDDCPFIQLFNPDDYDDSADAGRALFELLMQPYALDEFFSDIWEKRPVLLKRRCPSYNDGWFNSKALDTILEQNSLQYSVNINITSYEDEQRLTHNPPGRAYASTVREFYEQGCSIQLLNPQTYSKEMWMLGATLQEFFGCFVGANIYLTPSGTQGFAPHYDDIEAFVMQVEGKKRWRLYKPPSSSDRLAKTSSRNFKQSELSDLLLDVILEPGDLLYFPRGTVHQATALPNTHSLHITLSTFQKNTWGDFFEKMIPAALQTAIVDDLQFRKGLPMDYLSYVGSVHEDNKCSLRDEFIERVHMLMTNVINYLSIDSAADKMGLDFIHTSLPPYISKGERNTGVWRRSKNTRIEITLNTQIKLIRKGVIRIVEDEENGTVLYYNTNNTRVYREKEPEGMQVEKSDVDIIAYLVQSYPEYVTVCELPAQDDEDKMDVAYMLYNQALLMIDSPDKDD